MVFDKNDIGVARFDLLRWFSTSAAIAIAVLSTLTASFFTHSLSQHVLAHDADVMTEFVNSIIRQDTESREELSILSVGEAGKLAVFFSQLQRVPGILRANVYSIEGKVIWSSESELSERHFGDNEELKLSLAGTPVAHLENIEQSQKAEHVLLAGSDSTFVEYYLPIWEHQPAGRVMGVAEVYRVPLNLLDQLASIRFTAWLASVAGGGFLFISLFWIVRRADRIIHVQDQQILDAGRMAVIGEMASTVAHGLRNPLSSIRSSAELALEYDSDEHVRRLLTDIMAESDSMEAWVKRYLANIESTATEGERSDLHELLGRAVRNVTSYGDRQGISIELHLSGEKIFVQVNPVLLEQIVAGLIANAIEARPTDKKVRLVCASEGAYTTILVEDRGCGIPEDTLEKIFDAFYTTKRNGVGIGLYLTRQIIRRAGGDIRVSSNKKIGTRFELKIPVETAR